MFRQIHQIFIALPFIVVAIAAQAQAQYPITRPDHVVVVIEENHGYNQIIGSPEAPYINALATAGALLTDSHGTGRPSQPNYLDLFSGSNQGINHNNDPGFFTAPSLGGSLIAAGFSFTGYAQSMPSVGFTGLVDGPGNRYVRKHNPWVDFLDVPASANRPFTDFPTDFNQLSTVSFVVPDLVDGMHDGTIAQGDAWLQANIASYATWAMTHNSLLIVTWDEDNFTTANHIPTIFYGPMIAAGAYNQNVNHFNILRTLEDMYNLPLLGQSSVAAPIPVGVAAPEPSSGLLALYAILLLPIRQAKYLRKPFNPRRIPCIL
jgi:phosphatidylinositol-3-phosphatase